MLENAGAVINQKKEKWVENFARLGIVAKGIVYCLIGILTAMAAVGMRGEKASKTDAFKLIYEQPFGKVLLIIVALGLFGYVTWRLFQAFRDIEHKGSDLKAKLVRVGYAVSAVIYTGIAIYALKLALNGSGSGDENSQTFFVNKVLSYPMGAWIIGIGALLILGNGIRQIYKGVSGSFMKNVQFLADKNAEIFKKTGIAGYVSRGVVLLIIGYFFLRAALHHNGSEVQDTKGAFDFIESTFGSLLLACVAIGLAGYGIFMFVKARYQKIDLNF